MEREGGDRLEEDHGLASNDEAQNDIMQIQRDVLVSLRRVQNVFFNRFFATRSGLFLVFFFLFFWWETADVKKYREATTASRHDGEVQLSIRFNGNEEVQHGSGPTQVAQGESGSGNASTGSRQGSRRQSFNSQGGVAEPPRNFPALSNQAPPFPSTRLDLQVRFISIGFVSVSLSDSSISTDSSPMVRASASFHAYPFGYFCTGAFCRNFDVCDALFQGHQSKFSS